MRNTPSALAAGAAIVAGLLGAGTACADSIQVDFSGVFAVTVCLQCAATSPFDGLLGTTFSGSIRFPASQAAAISTDLRVDPPTNSAFGTHALRADYSFDPADASFQLHTALPAFDAAGNGTLVVMVQNCTNDESVCEGKSDFLWVMLTTPNYRYTLYTILAGGVDSVDMPSLAQLQDSEPLTFFDVETLDFNDGVAPRPLFPSPLTVHFSSVPAAVPLGGAAPLFALSLGIVGLSARRGLRRR